VAILRIVVPYTKIHLLTAACLDELAPDAERVYVGGEDIAYWRLFCDLWHDGEDFLIIEHDIQFTQEALDQALHCPCQWGASPYHYGANNLMPELINTALGFTRFRSGIIGSNPKLPDDLGEFKRCLQPRRAAARAVRPPIHWNDLNLSVAFQLRPGHVHVHCPVLHHHMYDGICACGGEHD
jgi:hypothetical protein